MHELLPAILVHDAPSFHARMKLMEGVATTVHLDVMDGAFVPDRTWFDAVALAAISTPLRIELHLMVTDPRRYLEQVRDIASVIRIIWQLEAATDHLELAGRCRTTGKEAGLAINPTTPIDRLVPIADALDEILVLGAEPGLSGQTMAPASVSRVWDIRGRWPEKTIGFDIGVNADTIPKLKQAGVTRFCAASAIFGAEDPVAEAKKLQGLL